MTKQLEGITAEMVESEAKKKVAVAGRDFKEAAKLSADLKTLASDKEAKEKKAEALAKAVRESASEFAALTHELNALKQQLKQARKSVDLQLKEQLLLGIQQAHALAASCRFGEAGPSSDYLLTEEEVEDMTAQLHAIEKEHDLPLTDVGATPKPASLPLHVEEEIVVAVAVAAAAAENKPVDELAGHPSSSSNSGHDNDGDDKNGNENNLNNGKSDNNDGNDKDNNGSSFSFLQQTQEPEQQQQQQGHDDDDPQRQQSEGMVAQPAVSLAIGSTDGDGGNNNDCVEALQTQLEALKQQLEDLTQEEKYEECEAVSQKITDLEVLIRQRQHQ